MLIATRTLAQHLDNSTWVVFDCRHDLVDHQRGAKLYAQSHIPGAHFAPVENALSGPKSGRNGRHPLPEPADFATFLSSHGVTADTQIVAYDDVGGQYAARLWWLARWIGLRKIAVLDGGFPKWQADNLPVTAAVPTPGGTGQFVARANPSLSVTAEDILALLPKDKLAVVDARAAERFRGETEPIDTVAGRIPGAVNRFFKLNLNADLTMRPAAELRREFEALLGGRSPADVAHQCGSGITACANVLAMEHAGLSGSKLYPGSWSEWIADPTRPIARG